MWGCASDPTYVVASPTSHVVDMAEKRRSRSECLRWREGKSKQAIKQADQMLPEASPSPSREGSFECASPERHAHRSQAASQRAMHTSISKEADRHTDRHRYTDR
uniref:Uncharacterized protein n=1 Tax=Physcomitrium patens TaxID=3218 RepID=A0A2K1ISH4_PHYPA|nr:hypothetical protein PHYPA_026356 [Physcomitrium patens]